MRANNTFLFKAVNVFTALTFLFSGICADSVWAARTPAQPLSAEPNKAGGSWEALDLSNITVPLRFGEIRETHKGTNGKTIIHIQDAHCNYAAQSSIEAIIEHLTDNYDNVNLLSLEGGKGNYDLSIFTNIADSSIRRKVSDFFVKEGRVSGPEFFAINNPDKVELFGIEDERLYRENLSTYRNSLSYKEEADRWLNTLSNAINNLKMKMYSPRMKELDDRISGYQSGRIDFKDYIVFLADKAKEANIDPETWKTIASLVSILNDEKAINFKEADRERNKLIEKINKRVSKRDLEDLVIKSSQFKMGDITSEEFYSYLFNKARFSGVDFSSLPNLVKYSEYMKKYESLDKTGIFKEAKAVEDVLFNKDAKAEDQRTLRSLDRDLSIMKDMFNISLMKDEFDYYEANKDSFRMKRFIGFINTKAPLNGLNFKLNDDIVKLDKYRDNMEKFYKYSLKRDNAFIKNIEKKMKDKNKDSTILVTGGFHTGNLSKLFKDRGYSYIEVMPKFGKTDGESPYFRLLAGGETTFEQFMDNALSPPKPGASTIAIESLFSEMGVDRKSVLALDLQAKLLALLMSGDGSVTIGHRDWDGAQAQGWGTVDFIIGDKRADMPGHSVTVGGLTISAEYHLGKGADNNQPDLWGDGVSWLTKAQQDQRIDGLGIKAGAKEIEAKYRKMIMGALTTKFGLSEPDAIIVLGGMDKELHDIYMWNRSLGNIGGHFGRRNEEGKTGGPYARVYLSPDLLTDTMVNIGGKDEPLKGDERMAIALLHEVGSMYNLKHSRTNNEVIEFTTPNGDWKDMAGKVVSAVKAEKRVEERVDTAASIAGMFLPPWKDLLTTNDWNVKQHIHYPTTLRSAIKDIIENLYERNYKAAVAKKEGRKITKLTDAEIISISTKRLNEAFDAIDATQRTEVMYGMTRGAEFPREKITVKFNPHYGDIPYPLLEICGISIGYIDAEGMFQVKLEGYNYKKKTDFKDKENDNAKIITDISDDVGDALGRAAEGRLPMRFLDAAISIPQGAPAMPAELIEKIEGIRSMASRLPAAAPGAPDIGYHARSIDVKESTSQIQNSISRLLDAIEQNLNSARQSGLVPESYGNTIGAIRPVLAELNRLNSSTMRGTAIAQVPAAADMAMPVAAPIMPAPAEIPQEALGARAQAFEDRISGKDNNYRLPNELSANQLDALKKQFGYHVIGMTTFSGQLVDEAVKARVKAQLKGILLSRLRKGEKIVVVIGSTNLGGVKDGYDVLDETEFRQYRDNGQLKTMGLVAGMGVLAAHQSQGKDNAYGIRNTDYLYIHEEGQGWRDDLNDNGPGGWGVESETFQNFIDELVSFGGGDQAALEIAGVAGIGKPVTALLDVKNGAKVDGEAELKVRVAKLGNTPEGRAYVEKVKSDLETQIKATTDEKALKTLNKQLKTVNKALEFTMSDAAKKNIVVVSAAADMAVPVAAPAVLSDAEAHQKAVELANTYRGALDRYDTVIDIVNKSDLFDQYDLESIKKITAYLTITPGVAIPLITVRDLGSPRGLDIDEIGRLTKLFRLAEGPGAEATALKLSESQLANYAEQTAEKLVPKGETYSGRLSILKRNISSETNRLLDNLGMKVIDRDQYKAYLDKGVLDRIICLNVSGRINMPASSVSGVGTAVLTFRLAPDETELNAEARRVASRIISSLGGGEITERSLRQRIIGYIDRDPDLSVNEASVIDAMRLKYVGREIEGEYDYVLELKPEDAILDAEAGTIALHIASIMESGMESGGREKIEGSPTKIREDIGALTSRLLNEQPQEYPLLALYGKDIADRVLRQFVNEDYEWESLALLSDPSYRSPLGDNSRTFMLKSATAVTPALAPAMAEAMPAFDVTKYMDELKTKGPEILKAVYPRVFGGEPAAQIIELSAVQYEDKKSLCDGVKSALVNHVAEKLGDKITLIYVNKDDVNKKNVYLDIFKQLKEKVPASHIVAYAYADLDRNGNAVQSDYLIADINNKDRNVCKAMYMNGKDTEDAKIITSIGACFLNGLTWLNRSYIKEQQESGVTFDEGDWKTANRQIMISLSMMGTLTDSKAIEDLLEKDPHADLSQVMMLVMLTPINVEKISELHKNEIEVLRAL